MGDARDVIRRFSDEAHGAGRVELVNELCTEDFVNHSLPEELPPGREGEKAFIQMVHDAFSDLEASTERIVVDGDRAAWRWRSRGTHTGEFMGIPASGTRIEITGNDIVVLRDGKIAEAWYEFDMLDLMTQLGAMQAPAS